LGPSWARPAAGSTAPAAGGRAGLGVRQPDARHQSPAACAWGDERPPPLPAALITAELPSRLARSPEPLGTVTISSTKVFARLCEPPPAGAAYYRGVVHSAAAEPELTEVADHGPGHRRRDAQPHQSLPRLLGPAEKDRPERPRRPDRARRALRPARPQRLRQDHHHQTPPRPALPDLRRGVRLRRADAQRRQERAHRLPAGRVVPVPLPQRRGDARL